MDTALLKICATRCDQCLFSAERIVSKARMAELIKTCREADTFFVCHKHKNVMCRGYYETQPPAQQLRIAERLQAAAGVPLIAFVPTT